MIQDVGARLRNIRKARGMTLTTLSQQTGLSVGHLSNLERDLTSPTLDNIQQICSVLDISLVELLRSNQYADEVVRKSEREVVFEQKGQICYQSIRFNNALLDALVISVQPHCKYDQEWQHDYDEIGLVLKGSLTIQIDSSIYELHEGDSFYIRSGYQHNLSNYADDVCVSYWVKMGKESKPTC